MLLRNIFCISLCICIQIVKQTSCKEGISLVFAIDDTRSMKNDIQQVRKGAKEIMNMVLTKKSSEVKDMVLITINDPDVILRTKTTSPDVFLQHLNSIRPHNTGNSDCEEMSLTGIEKALLASRPQSYVYVFTDATAKDYDELNKIKNMCQKKQSQVVFVLTGDCRQPTSPMYTVYNEVAKSCSGQVFRVQKDQVGSVLKTIEVLLQGKNSIFEWKNVPRTGTYVPVMFKLDAKAEYALVSTSGKHVRLRITTINNFWGSEPRHEKTMWNENGKVVKLVNPKPGTYYAWVKGDSTISVVVHGRTDFTFDYGFSTLEPKSMSETSKQPLAGLKQHLTIQVTDPENSVAIKTAQILDIKNDDNVVAELPLKKTGENVYMTDPFISPNYTFRIAVKGEIKETQEPITRYSRTNVDAYTIVDTIPESVPEINIIEGSKVDVNYGSQITLTCEVIAHPAPKIEWSTSSNDLSASESSVIEDPKFVSYLKLEHIKHSETYVCKASNKLGPGSEKRIEINVRPVFKNNEIPEVTGYNAKFGEDIIIPCNISSYLPIQIKWFKAGNELSNQSESHFVSPDGFILRLMSMNMNMQGVYTCEATLNSDPSKKETHNTKVTLSGLVPPRIQSTTRNIQVMKGDKLKLECKTIQGNPKPDIKWYKMHLFTFILLPVGNVDVLKNDVALYEHAGRYRCDATNYMGSDTITFDVTVKSPPEITVPETERKYPYNSNAVFNCKVEAYPPPIIVWKDEKGSVVQNKVTQISEYVFVNRLELNNVRHNAAFVCEATNEVGSKTEHVNITVPTKFEVKQHINGTVKIPYGKKHTLECNIKSDLSMTIKWFRNGLDVKLSNDKYSVSDDDTKLTINSMDLDLVGKYTCEASLYIDPTEKVVFGEDVNVVGLEAPAITNVESVFYGTEGDKELKIPCNVTGIPYPTVIWKNDGKPINSDSKLSIEGTTLNIRNPAQTDSNKYTCEANNDLGTATKTFAIEILDPIPEYIPKVYIKEGETIDVNYKSKVSLTCNVNAHPKPKIEWYSSNGLLLESESLVIEDPMFVSNLNIENIEHNEVYTCKASNKLGIGLDKTIQVNVRPIFQVNHIPKETGYNPGLGADVTIPCNITSYLPIQIKWFKAGKELTHNSETHSISPDGFELTLQSMNIDMQGVFTCEATLNSDPSVKQTHNTNVKLSGLAPPKIQPSNRNINLLKRDKFELDCRIVQGFPKPQVKWYKKYADSYIPLSDVGDVEVLTADVGLFKHAGQYRCDATNELGNDTAIFEVNMSSRPEITIPQTERSYPYNSRVVFNCQVEANPPPNILWKDEKGSIMQNKVTQVSEYEFVNKLEVENARKDAVFTCEASNKVGLNTEYVNITVPSPFEVRDHIDGFIGIYYKSADTLLCDIRADMPMIIRWSINGTDVASSRDKYSVSDDGTKLAIKSMDLDMAGKYTCEASLLIDPTERVVFSTDASVVGLISPEVISATTVSNGKNFTAICRIKGIPMPVISWEFKPKGSEDFHAIPGFKEELNIPEISLKDSGVYKCIAKNILGDTARDFNVVVEEPPIITNEETEYIAVEGDAVMKIPCNVTGFPDPTIMWKRGDQILDMDSKFTIMNSTLYINNPVQFDSNEYSCEATNKLGTATKTFSAEVVDNFEGDDRFDGESHDVFAEQDKPKSIKCNITNLGDGSVRWFKDGTLTKQIESIYTIERISDEDEANYTCRVNTNEDSISETYIVHVGYPPTFEDNIRYLTIEWQDNDQKLDCSANAEPSPQYEWLHNGKTIQSGNDLNEKLITDWGEYVCKVSNAHGGVEKRFKVMTSGCFISKNIGTVNQPVASDLDTPTWPYSISNSDILLKQKEQIKLSCPSKKYTKATNGFKKIPDKAEIIATCITEDKFSVAGRTFKYSDLQCNTEIEPSIKTTGQHCSGDNSELIRVGFQVNGFLDAYNVCYDRNLDVPIFASAPTPISRIGNGADLDKFKWSSTTELVDRKTTAWEPKNSCECCYIKGQLVSVNDVPFGPAQESTFKDNLNLVPIWNPSCDDSNRMTWQNFDNQIRESSLMFRTWSSWTGASEYTNVDGELVPRYLWKVMKYDGYSSVIVFVNDKYPVDIDLRCSTVCNSALPVETDQYLYCCSVQEFTSRFGVPLDTFLNSN